MLKNLLTILLSCFTITSFSQKVSLAGKVMDEKNPVLYATVSLLNAQDSTLLHYCISNDQGAFEIKNIPAGNYILQSGAFGYKSYMKNIRLGKDSLCILPMELQGNNLKEVDIITDAIPLLIKGDTIEYNAGAFKTRSDATTEDLLKKLPGVEVDRAGNVKAQGENVSKVLVDGKEFFGNDPKVATKNLPADAVKKVQVYDKKSDEAELTGIDDGSHQKIVNLVLKDGKKSAILGDVMAGGGTGGHYQTAAKVYRFKQKTQFAALGMLNNINQFGFTFSDYLSFSGGLNSLTSGDGLGNILNNNSPVNFGQPVLGLVTSGAGGLNYTYEKDKGDRFNISYLGNGSEKKLDETVYSKNFVSGNSFEKYDTTSETNRRQGHTLQLNWRKKIDSTQNIILRANGSYALSKQNSNSLNRTGSENTWINLAHYISRDENDELGGNFSLSYLKRLYTRWRLFKISAEANAQNSHNNSFYANTISYPLAGITFKQDPFQQNANTALNGALRTSVMRRLANGFYLEPKITAGIRSDGLDRKQGLTQNTEQAVDSLSPSFTTKYIYGNPGLVLKKNTEKTQFSITAEAELGQIQNVLNQNPLNTRDYFFITPQLSWEREYKQQKRIGFYYDAYINTPSAFEMLPVRNALNPLQVYTGNARLVPEYIHRANARWWIFDQFSMTSFFAGIDARYTKNKVSFAREVMPDLSQTLTMVNVPEDYIASANVDFSTPVRKLKLNVSINLKESWNKGMSLVNDVMNVNQSLTHSATVTLDNRKKDKWDLRTSYTIAYTDARYSLQAALNNTYYQHNWFTEISFTPSKRISLLASADITSYKGNNFKSSVTIPLLKAEARFYFLKNNRGILSLEAFDLLNKNTGIQRVSELNYLMERHSTIIQQYFMLSFKFKLNKFDMNQGINIDVKGM